MEFKKCQRCGCFFVSEDNVCHNCMAKDRADSIKLQNYLEEHVTPSSLEEISIDTGISLKNLSRIGESQIISGMIENLKRDIEL